ncbi:hypothetical protein PR003_g17304 [Phytophthora rubi]|nr:hypothetical protein PR003_g17304 [Phytophthora rubi]
MPAEMRAFHDQVYRHFTGVGRRATRKSARILEAITDSTLDESATIPLYDQHNAQVHWLRIEHVLNFVYYHGTNRRIPRGVTVGASLFEETVSNSLEVVAAASPEARPLNVANTASPGQLSDSEEDGETEEAAPPPPTKRRRVENVGEGNLSQLERLRQSFQDQPAMTRDIDQLIAFRSAGMPGLRDTVAPVTTGDTGAQFRPSALQVAIHGGIVNGKYAGLSGQLFVEVVQSDFEEYDFLPHPTVCRGLYSWDFGMRGLSSTHFRRLDEEAKRSCARKYDMSNFSRSYKMPTPAPAQTVAELVDALDVLSALVERVFATTVVNLVHTARRFLMQPGVQADMVGPESAQALTQWVDERFERYRTYIARGDTTAAAAVQAEFSVDHVVYARMVHKRFGARFRHYCLLVRVRAAVGTELLKVGEMIAVFNFQSSRNKAVHGWLYLEKCLLHCLNHGENHCVCGSSQNRVAVVMEILACSKNEVISSPPCYRLSFVTSLRLTTVGYG